MILNPLLSWKAHATELSIKVARSVGIFYKLRYLEPRHIARICIMLFYTIPGFLKNLYLILRFNFGAVHFSITKLLVLPDSRDMYKSFGT